MRAILIGAGLALGLAACEPAEETEPAADPMPAGPVDDAIAPFDRPVTKTMCSIPASRASSTM